MTFEEALTFELEQLPGLSESVYPVFEPGRAEPYVVYQSSEGRRTKALDGYKEGRVVPCELHVIVKRYSELKQHVRDIIDALISFEGRIIGEDGPHVQEITYEEPVELYEEKPKLHRCVIEFEVYY